MRTLAALALLTLPASSFAQVSTEPFSDVAVAIDSRAAGLNDNNPRLAADGLVELFRDTIRVPDATWLQVYFDGAELGSTGVIRITSLDDGATQTMSAAGLAEWDN